MSHKIRCGGTIRHLGNSPKNLESSTQPAKPTEALASAVNWEGIAAFLGRPVDSVQTVALRPAVERTDVPATPVPIPKYVRDRETAKLYKKRHKLTSLRRLGRLDAVGEKKLADIERQIDDLAAPEIAAATARFEADMAKLDAIHRSLWRLAPKIGVEDIDLLAVELAAIRSRTPPHSR